MTQKQALEFKFSPVKLPEIAEDDTVATIDTPSNIIEEILDKIGLGKYHWITYSIIGIYWICDGAEVMGLSLINYVMVNVFWFRSPTDISMLGSCLFGGYLIGSLIIGPITKYFGRRKPFLVFMALIFILGVKHRALINILKSVVDVTRAHCVMKNEVYLVFILLFFQNLNT